MKKGIIVCLILVLIVFAGAPYAFFLSVHAAADHPFARADVFSDFTIASRTNIRLGNPEVLYNLDTHGGFHGDGDWLAVLQYGDDSLLRAIENSNEWKPLPLPAALKEVSGLLPSVSDEAKQDVPPEETMLSAEHGYYFFLNRRRGKENKNPKDESILLLHQYSYNFTLAVYDADSAALWIMEIDT